jgi:2-polyprenyl-3-methyl-5-hydroxy-6-metoxy-1,4-benzoquinol methylase
LFGVLWESSEILARIMENFDVEGKRILEVGCGVGLASLLLNSRNANITATDHHPDADAYLQWNVNLNAGLPIPFVRTGWEDECKALGIFDLIIGSDILYQPNHPALLSHFIARHAKPKCQVIIVDPSRGNGNQFTREMDTEGFSQERLSVDQYLVADQHYKGQIRSFTRS